MGVWEWFYFEGVWGKWEFLILILSERLPDLDKKNHRDRKSVIWQKSLKNKKRERGKVVSESLKSDRKK